MYEAQEIDVVFNPDELVQVLDLALAEARGQGENNEDNLEQIDELVEALNTQEDVNAELVRAIIKLGKERDEARRLARIFYKRFLNQLPNVVSWER